MNLVIPFLRMARQQPDRPALVFAGQTLTYGELLTRVARMAAGLAADGVRAGQRVAVFGHPVRRVVSTLALGWIGAVSMDTSGIPGKKLGKLADALGLDVVYPRPGLDVGAVKARLGNIDQLPATTGSPSLWPGNPDALWRIAVSSGTTGRPKGIACTYASVLNVHLLRTVYPCGPGDVVAIAMNAAMGFAVHNWLRCLYSGACVLLAENLRPAELLALLQGDQPTHCMVTPVMANELAAICAPGEIPAPAAGKRLHTFSVGGGRVSASVRDAVQKHICPNFIGHYGAAEAQIVSVLDPQLAASRPDCTGRLLPWIEAQVIGPDGKALPMGEVGRLRFRSPALATGYIGHADDEAFRDGWFLSQDRGSLGPEGLVFLRGRANDVINLAGVKLDPEMLEEAILADRGILECAVVDVPGPRGPELVAVIVDPAGTADFDAVIERCRNAGSGVRPRRVLRTEKLPRNANGKVMRGALRRAVEQGGESAS